MKRRLRHLLTLLSIFVFACCTRSHDPRLVDIDRLSDSIPSLAAEKFTLIDRDGLSEHDGFYYDLLRLKIADKTNVDISRDSLILYITDYFEDHGDKATYSQALYYGGRVYSERGDYPTALEFYQKAIDNFPTDPEYLERKSNLLGQTSSLYLYLHINTKGIQYASECVSVDIQMKDSARLADDMRVLGALYYRTDSIEKGKKTLQEALDLARRYSPMDTVSVKSTLANLFVRQGDYVQALNTIRGLAEESSWSRSHTLILASKIYLANGILDTAYIYARKLIDSGDSTYMRNAYNILLKKEMRKLIPMDSLDIYISRQNKLTEEYVVRNEAESFIIQDARYNYQIHLRHREEAESKVDLLTTCLICVIIIGLISFVIFLVISIRNKNKIIHLQRGLDRLRFANEILRRRSERYQTELKSQKESVEEDRERKREEKSLEPDSNENVTENKESKKNNPEILTSEDVSADEHMPVATESESTTEVDNISEIDEIQLRIDREIIEIKRRIKESPGVPETVRQDIVYQKILQILEAGKTLSEKNHLWIKIEKLVEKLSPNFKQNIRLFTGYKMKDFEMHIYYLIRLGFQPAQIASLLTVTKGGVSYYRNKISKKFKDILTEEFTIDEIIRHL